MSFPLIALMLLFAQTSFTMQQYYTEDEQAHAFTTFLKRQKPTAHECTILQTLLPEIHEEAKKNRLTTEQQQALFALLCHAERYLPNETAYIQEIMKLLHLHIASPDLQKSESLLRNKFYKISSMFFVGSTIILGTLLFALTYQTFMQSEDAAP